MSNVIQGFGMFFYKMGNRLSSKPLITSVNYDLETNKRNVALIKKYRKLSICFPNHHFFIFF